MNTKELEQKVFKIAQQFAMNYGYTSNVSYAGIIDGNPFFHIDKGYNGGHNGKPIFVVVKQGTASFLDKKRTFEAMKIESSFLVK